MTEQASLAEEIRHSMAKAFFASAYADLCEEGGRPLSGEILDQVPDEMDPAAVHAAQTLVAGICQLNYSYMQTTDEALVALHRFVEGHAEGDREPTADNLGHYLAMQAMGSGVGIQDAFGKYIHDAVAVPYVEFGSHSLQRDYLIGMGEDEARAILEALNRLRDEGPFSKHFGICWEAASRIGHHARTSQVCLQLLPAFNDWPEFSGNEDYPVPVPHGDRAFLADKLGLDPEDVGPNDGFSLPDLWDGAYGDARRRLLNHCIEWLQVRLSTENNTDNHTY